ncbi:Serine/threonine protein kinase [Giardia duodenalis]|uniref:Serine/threonine protein kinase n=1 Tax=Giardia intestinalis TaxID=5741 RepID=V6TNV1_GIAIN|nr:Serine/threonine protein kinase [Giardia intestinalis]
MAVIEDRQKVSTTRIPTRMASSAHRMNGQTSIAEAAQLRADGPSPGRQSSNPQQYGEPDGQGPSGLKFVCWEAPGTREGRGFNQSPATQTQRQVGRC